MSSAPVRATSFLLSYEVRNRLVELTVSERLVEEAVRSFLHSFDRCCLVRKGRDHEYPYRRLQLHQLRNSLDPIHLRHREVHRHNVRVRLPEQLERLEAVAGRTDQLELVKLLRALKPSTHDIGIVNDHKLKRPSGGTVGAIINHGLRPDRHGPRPDRHGLRPTV